MPQFHGYAGIDEWVKYDNMDEDEHELDEDALLLDESRDWTDEDCARLLI